MAITSTSTPNFNQTVVTLVRKQLEQELRKPLVHLLPGNFVQARFVKGTNNTMRFLRVPDLNVVAGTPNPGTPPWLTEGTPPTSEALAFGYEEFSAAQAGRVIAITDVAMMESPLELLAVASERLARNAVETADLRVAEVLATGTNVQYANGKTSRSGVLKTDVLNASEIRKAVAHLKRRSVPPFPDGYYRAIIHPNVVYDLMSDSAAGGWIDASRYGAPEQLYRGEIGRLAGVRFLESPNAQVFAGAGGGTPAADVYSTIIFGPEAYVFGDWHTIEPHVIPPGGDHSDPLSQQALAGWKGFFGVKLLEAAGARYIRIESGSSL